MFIEITELFRPITGVKDEKKPGDEGSVKVIEKLKLRLGSSAKTFSVADVFFLAFDKLVIDYLLLKDSLLVLALFLSSTDLGSIGLS